MPTSSYAKRMVGTRSLSLGAHSRDPVALPTLRKLTLFISEAPRCSSRRTICVCCALASGEPLPPRPVVRSAICIGVEPFLFLHRISAPLSSRIVYRRGATRAYRPVQRRHAAVVHGIGIGTGLDEKGDGRSLCAGIPVERARAAIDSVVQRLRAKAISSHTRSHPPLSTFARFRPGRQRRRRAAPCLPHINGA